MERTVGQKLDRDRSGDQPPGGYWVGNFSNVLLTRAPCLLPITRTVLMSRGDVRMGHRRRACGRHDLFATRSFRCRFTIWKMTSVSGCGYAGSR
jgi:hypothetical protein